MLLRCFFFWCSYSTILLLNLAPHPTSSFQFNCFSYSSRLSSSTSSSSLWGRGEDQPEPETTSQPLLEENTPTLSEYVFGKPGEFKKDLNRLGSSPRRFFFQTTIIAPGVALAGNLFGCTSALLSHLPPEFVAATRLDCYYPARGFLRYVDPIDASYELLVPQGWLQDQAIVLARADRFSTSQQPVEYAMTPRRKKKEPSTLPDVAFGPPERSGDNTENLSVVRSRLPLDFSLRGSLGPPERAAQLLLDSAIAPPGSGRTAELLAAREVVVQGDATEASDSGGDAQSYYELEYVLTRQDGRVLRNLAVVAARADLSQQAAGQAPSSLLFTFTVLAPEAEWAKDKLVALPSPKENDKDGDSTTPLEVEVRLPTVPAASAQLAAAGDVQSERAASGDSTSATARPARDRGIDTEKGALLRKVAASFRLLK